MSNDDPFNLLWDFVYWVRKRRPFQENAREAWVSEETLDFVTKGVERFLHGEVPWTTPPEEKPRKRGRPASPDTPDLMWKCYYMACVVADDKEFLSQCRNEKTKKGGFDIVGRQLALSGQSIERYCSKAQKLLKTPKGEDDYHQWLTQLEKTFWCYNASCEEKAGKRKLKLIEEGVEIDEGTVFFRRKEFDEIVSNAQKCLFDRNGRFHKQVESIYKRWFAGYERRTEIEKSRPLRYKALPTDDPRAIAMVERRTAKGLRNGLTKAGRKRKNI